MLMESGRFTKVLNYKDQPVSADTLGKLALQLEALFQSPSVLTLNRIDASYPFWRFVIVENQPQNSQVAVEIDSKLESELRVLPVRLIIRLLERNERRLTRAIFTLSTRRVSNDFDRYENLSDHMLGLLDGEGTLEVDPRDPAWYNPAFLEEVSNALEGATVSAELLQKVLNYYQIKHTPRYQMIQQRK